MDILDSVHPPSLCKIFAADLSLQNGSVGGGTASKKEQKSVIEAEGNVTGKQLTLPY